MNLFTKGVYSIYVLSHLGVNSVSIKVLFVVHSLLYYNSSYPIFYVAKSNRPPPPKVFWLWYTPKCFHLKELDVKSVKAIKICSVQQANNAKPYINIVNLLQWDIPQSEHSKDININVAWCTPRITFLKHQTRTEPSNPQSVRNSYLLVNTTSTIPVQVVTCQRAY
jgi:hypothetical protein